MIWCIKTYIIAYIKTQKKDILSIMSNLQPNCCLKFDFQKVDQHAGGKWVIHDTKRRKDNRLQRLKLPCKISKTTWPYPNRVTHTWDLNAIFNCSCATWQRRNPESSTLLAVVRGIRRWLGEFCYICMVSQISPHWMHSDTMHIQMPWWDNLSTTPSN